MSQLHQLFARAKIPDDSVSVAGGRGQDVGYLPVPLGAGDIVNLTAFLTRRVGSFRVVDVPDGEFGISRTGNLEAIVQMINNN